MTADCGVDSMRGEADAAEEREGGAVGGVEGVKVVEVWDFGVVVV